MDINQSTGADIVNDHENGVDARMLRKQQLLRRKLRTKASIVNAGSTPTEADYVSSHSNEKAPRKEKFARVATSERRGNFTGAID